VTSTDLAPRMEAPNKLAKLEEWIDCAAKVHQIAQAICKTSFVPKSMQNRPDEVAAAILAGDEIDLPPMAALRSIDIIDGTPAVRAIALRAVVLSHGHDIWVKESSATRAVVCGKRAGSDKIETSVWDMDRARTANLAGKKNWQTNPTAMLVARATAECARLVAADAMLGMPYSVEEIQDGVIYNTETGEATPIGPTEVHTPKKRTMRRAAWQNADADAGVPEPANELPAEEKRPELGAAPAEPDWPETAQVPA
jgi:hypothetical protein